MPSVQFIDFEYSAYVPRGFDLGNHFNEYAGFECEYSRYPDRAHVSNFVRGYMAEGSQQMPVRPRANLACPLLQPRSAARLILPLHEDRAGPCRNSILHVLCACLLATSLAAPIDDSEG